MSIIKEPFYKAGDEKDPLKYPCEEYWELIFLTNHNSMSSKWAVQKHHAKEPDTLQYTQYLRENLMGLFQRVSFVSVHGLRIK